MSAQDEPTSPEAPFGSGSIWELFSGPAPAEVTAEMRQSAQAARNAFNAYLSVGFTEPQALTLTAHLVTPLRAS